MKRQKDKWPEAVYGKLTEKTNMKTLRSVLLDQDLGFTTITVPSVTTNASADAQVRVEGEVQGLKQPASAEDCVSKGVIGSIEQPAGEFNIRLIAW